MSRAFSTMYTNVGNDVQDTTTTMAAFIKRYINRRYKQVLRAINWDVINEDYTVSVVAGTQNYELATDFKKELYALDTTNGTELARVDLQDLIRTYPSTLTASGTVERYSIYKSDNGKQYIKFHYKPASAITVALPYTLEPTELSSDSDTMVIDIEDLVEIGATADAWRYKRQFAKAKDMELLFNKNLAEYIWDKENQLNQVMQFKPATYNRDNLI